MPYIDDKGGHQRRLNLTPKCHTPENAGELNYQLTMVLKNYLTGHGESYGTFNDISGAMTECLAEFRRRVIVPYEIQKCEDNGDVY
jgi:hypothetical protein